MAIINIKFTKFDNTPWGFRLVGGSDFPQPLTVIKVLEGGLAECMGLKVGDCVVRLNDQPIGGLTHGQAHEALQLAGNNYVLGVQREEEALKAVENFSDDNIVPYKIPLDKLPPVYPEKILQEEIVVDKCEEIIIDSVQLIEEQSQREEKELIDEKPKDANSEVVPNKNLTDDEIAQLILEEEELLIPDQGVLGVNFKKLRPRIPVLKESKVVEELQKIASEPPARVQELKHTSTFLQKPNRPVPVPRPEKEESKEPETEETYKVVIKRQPKKSVTVRLLEKGLLQPGALRTPEAPSEIPPTPSTTPDPSIEKSNSRPESKAELVEEGQEIERNSSACSRNSDKAKSINEEEDSNKDQQGGILLDLENRIENMATTADRLKIKELVSTEISLEKQLEGVQRQLMALKQLPSEIENHLKIVSDQLQKIMELSGVNDSRRGSTDEQSRQENLKQKDENDDDEYEETTTTYREEISMTEITEERTSSALSYEPPRIIEPSEDEETEDTETRELGEISVKSNEEDGSRVKKFIVSYESKVLRSREPSPAPSYGSFEPDPNLSAKDQVIQELQHRKCRKPSQDMWPQAKQVELTLGRRWRCPNDFFNDEMIAEVLSSQAEVIRGKALGVNFKKYEKKSLPNYDHLMYSSVYKMIHNMEKEPRKGIPARPPKVNAAEDIRGRIRSPAMSIPDDRSNRSSSH